MDDLWKLATGEAQEDLKPVEELETAADVAIEPTLDPTERAMNEWERMCKVAALGIDRMGPEAQDILDQAGSSDEWTPSTKLLEVMAYMFWAFAWLMGRHGIWMKYIEDASEILQDVKDQMGILDGREYEE